MAKKQGPREERLVVPPHNVEAEQAVLGAIMLDPAALDRVADLLAAEDFYHRSHQLIYRAILALAEEGQPFDAVTLGERAESAGWSETIGGSSYLVELASTTPSAANVGAYARIVHEKATLRRVIDAGARISNLGLTPDGREAMEVVAEMEQIAFSVAEAGRSAQMGVITLRESAREVFELVRQRYENPGALSGVPCGYTDLDEMLSGLNASDLIVLAGRPSMGKTSLAMGMAEHVALPGNRTVAVYSMEMSHEQLTQRLISSVARVEASRLRTGALDDTDWSRIAVAMSKLSSRLLIDPTPALSPEVLRAKVRRLKREHDLALVIVDYLQLMQAPGVTENRNAEISVISRSLKAMAKELNVPVVALSQLNRGVEGRADKRPVMSDLRESGAIEQDADVIMFIYRDEYYNQDSPDKGLAEVIIAKQRNGPTGTVKLKFFPQYCRFDNLSRMDG